MEFNVNLHGVPAGFKQIGPTENNEYVSTFYGKTTNSINHKLTIETRNNKIFYTFTKANLIANEGRNGSYFGITLSTNFCFGDAERLYELFLAIYKEHIDNKLIKGNKYLTSEFSKETRSIIEKVFTEFFEKNHSLLQTIDKRFSNKKGNTALSYNIREISNSLYMDILKKYAYIELSPEFPSSREYQGKAQSLNKDIDRLQQELDKYIQNLKNLESEKSQLESKLKKAENNKTFQENIDKIENPIREINKYLTQRRINQGKQPAWGVKRILSIVIALLLALNIVCVFFYYSKLSNIEKHLNTEIEATTDDKNVIDQDQTNTHFDQFKHKDKEENKNNEDKDIKTNDEKK